MLGDLPEQSRFGLTRPAQSTPSGRAATGMPCSMLERMPKWMICVPLTIQWLWLSLRYRSLTLPSCANPAIMSGGLVGEGKLEYFSGMGQTARSATAPWCPVSTQRTWRDSELQEVMSGAKLVFPVMAKPDLGLCGYGVRRIDDMGELQDYLAAFPPNETVVLQQYLPQEGEAGIFYVRDPVTDKGRIIGLALRYFPCVVGDGVSSVGQLVSQDRRVRRITHSHQHASRYDASRVPAAGEVVRLSTVGSTRVGGLYRDGAAWITPRLLQAIDAIARDMPDFHFGRFDVRFDNLVDLAAGCGFTIMEINGAGSEAIEAWDPGTGLLAGLRMIFSKQRILFAIGDAMRARGVKPMGLARLMKLNARQQQLIALYPPSN